MFFLIPLGIAAVSAISASTVVGGAAIASTALALGLKRAADKVEEDNIRVVHQAKQNSKEVVTAYQANVSADKKSYKAYKANELSKEISLSDMNKADKALCLAQLNKMLIKK